MIYIIFFMFRLLVIYILIHQLIYKKIVYIILLIWAMCSSLLVKNYLIDFGNLIANPFFIRPKAFSLHLLICSCTWWCCIIILIYLIIEWIELEVRSRKPILRLKVQPPGEQEQYIVHDADMHPRYHHLLSCISCIVKCFPEKL